MLKFYIHFLKKNDVQKLLFFVFLSLIFIVPVNLAQGEFEEPTIMHVERGEKIVDKYGWVLDEREKSQFDGLPSEYEIAVELFRIWEIDRVVGSIELDFWFSVTPIQNGDPTDFRNKLPKFNFVNSRDIEISSEIIEKKFYAARVTGTFFTEMDFRNFPFEKLDLMIEIQPENADIKEIKFVIGLDSGILETAKVPGWESGEVKITVEDIELDEANVYSRFSANFFVERSIIGSFIKNLFPVIMITGLALLIFFIPENFTPRIYLTAPLLLALVYLHQGVLKEIPPVGYITVFDQIMMMNYALFLNAIVSLALQMRYQVLHPDKKQAKKINDIMRYFIPIIIGIGIIWVLVR